MIRRVEEKEDGLPIHDSTPPASVAHALVQWLRASEGVKAIESMFICKQANVALHYFLICKAEEAIVTYQLVELEMFDKRTLRRSLVLLEKHTIGTPSEELSSADKYKLIMDLCQKYFKEMNNHCNISSEVRVIDQYFIDIMARRQPSEFVENMYRIYRSNLKFNIDKDPDILQIHKKDNKAIIADLSDIEGEPSWP